MSGPREDQEHYASCVCAVEEPGHDLHRCDCGGSWRTADGQKEVVTFPGGAGDLFGALDDMIGRIRNDRTTDG